MSKLSGITESIIENKILYIRGQKVMLDFDLAGMYGVETKRLKEQVKRNTERFPEDFMFELSAQEVEDYSRSQNAALKRGYNIKYLPFAFTEHGVLMLSSVLRSKQATEVNIRIMRVYSKMKELLLMNKDILLKLEKLEKGSDKHDKEIQLIFSYIKKLIETPVKPKTSRIGFKKDW
ncbi:MAG: ORF6N domain-containing protein [Ferruginibacter sp.]